MKFSSVKNHIKRFGQDWREFSFSVAVGRIVLDCPLFAWEKRQHFYENRVYNYLKKRYQKTLQAEIAKGEGHGPRAQKRIWVMWWQGEEGMPPIVKACYRQLLRVKKDWEVVLITKDNWSEYVSFPDYVIEKVDSGKLTLTSFSDLMRAALLSKYGGAWFDATIYAFDLPKELEEDKFYTLHAPGMFPQFVFRGEWSVFMMYCPYEEMLFPRALNKLFLEYLERHNRFVDYLLVDYFIKFIRDNSEDFAKAIEDCQSNYGFYDLSVSINEGYDANKFVEMSNNSPLQKLTYKKEFVEETFQGEKTFYGWIKEK